MSEVDEEALSKLDLNTVQDINQLRKAAVYWNEKYLNALKAMDETLKKITLPIRDEIKEEWKKNM